MKWKNYCLMNDYREKIFDDYQRLKELMGEPGCSERAAKKMIFF